MKYLRDEILMFSFIVLAFFASCKHFSKLNKPIRYDDVFIAAGEEDSTGLYKILIAKYGRFIYTIDSIAGGAVDHHSYTGICGYSSDTIFLNYATSGHPTGFQEYLVVEASKTYLIQYFVNKPRRIFLRIDRPVVDF